MNIKEITLIDLIMSEGSGLTLSEVMNKTGLSKTTAYRNLENLTAMKLFYKNNGRYFPGPVLIRWMNTTSSKQCVTRIIDPYLQELLAEFNYTVHLVQLQDNMRGVYIQKLQHEGILQIKSILGNELPLFCTGAGRAILTEFTDSEIEDYFDYIGELYAYTEKTLINRPELFKLLHKFKEQGYTTEIEQNEDGVQCAGIAFRYADMILAISVVTTTLEAPEILDVIGKSLLRVKKEIIHDLNLL